MFYVVHWAFRRRNHRVPISEGESQKSCKSLPNFVVHIRLSDNMALIRLFKVPKHRKYEYKPRYWDQQKEDLKERLRRIEEAKQGNTEGMRDRIRAGLRQSRARDYQSMRTATIQTNVRLLVIIGILIAATYYILNYYLPRLVNMVESGSGM